MRYLLDTNAVSEFLKKTPNEKFIEWFDEQLEESLFLSVLPVGEIQKGIAKLPASKRKTELEEWFEKVLARYDGRILPIGLSTAKLWGSKKGELESRGVVLAAIDSLIAATALERNLTLITRNEDDFTEAGVKILNLWKP